MRKLAQHEAVTKNRYQSLLVLLTMIVCSVGLTGCVGLAGGNTPGNGNGSQGDVAIIGAQASVATTTSFHVAWTTNVPASTQVEYGTTTAYGSTTPADATMVTAHQVMISNLKTGTLYHFRVHSTDAAGNSAVSSDMTFATEGDAVAPTVSIAAPAAGATLSGTATISANASDNIGVASVQFKVDSANVGSAVTAAPFSYSLNTKGLSNGNHVVSAVARDAAGNSTTSGTVSFKIDNTTTDTTAPTVSINSPVNNATVSSTITISANASDNVGVEGVQFRLDGANFGAADTASPFSVSLNTTTIANGNHTLTAVAHDAANNSTTSAAITIKVNNTTPDKTAPTVSLTSPANSATVKSTVTVSANATDNVGVASVQFQLDGANVGSALTSAPYNYSWNTTTSSKGTHTLRAIAKDAAGNSTTSGSVTVTVNNTVADTTAPTVSLTSPANSATVKNTITVTANAADNTGVASVQFQLDGANVGSALTAAPYSMSWNTTTSSKGTHTLRAIAKDAAGNSTTSGSVTVTVNNTVTDTTAPTVSLSTPANGSTVSGTVTVSANASDNVGVASVQFQLDGANAGGADAGSPYSYSWDTTKSTKGTHTLRAIAKDAAGNSTTSGSVTVTVNNAPTTDTTAPSVPGGVAATATSSSQINVTWNSSTDNIGVTGYRIYRGGSQIATSTSTSYQDTGLTASTSYSYTVSATDAAGNASAQSGAASATTQANQSSGGGTGTGSGIPSALGWYQIPNSKITSNCPTNSDIQGSTGCEAVTTAWGSGLPDTKRNRLIIWGGGHSDYYGNEIYSLDLNSLTMSRITNPSTGSAISNLNSCPDVYSDGNPSSRHTGGALQYLPNQDLYFTYGWGLPPCGNFGNSLFVFDPNASKWTHKTPAAPTPRPDVNGSEAIYAYDATSDRVYGVETNTGNFWQYNEPANSWANLGYISGCTNTQMHAVIDPVRKLYFCAGGGGFWKVTLTAPYKATSLSASGCGSLASFKGPALEYDPDQKKLVAWLGGNTVYIYNPDTDSCTSSTFSGGPSNPDSNGTYGRFRYFPSLKVFALVSDAQQNAYTLRLTASTGSTNNLTIGSVLASAITTTGATITWTTSTAATSQVEYGLTTAYGLSTTINTSLVTNHSVVLGGLVISSLYHYRIHSKDASGVETISPDFAVATNTNADSTPPAVSLTSPGNGSTVSGSVNVQANATDNVGVSKVQFQLDGNQVGTATTGNPYSMSWDTTATSDGSHTLTATASDASGNVTNSTSVTVTVNNSNSSATPEDLQDFQTRCGQTGVLVCEGFDSASSFTTKKADGSGVYPAGDGAIRATYDSTISSSGSGSLKFTIPTYSGANAAGYWKQLMGQTFAQNSTFYVQFRQRFSPEFLTNKWGGTTYWKQEIFSSDQSTCGNIELTTINANMKGWPEMYSACGQDLFDVPTGSSDYLLEQGDTATTGYNCHYQNPTADTCFMYPANTWVTFYYKVQIGNWGQPNSNIQAWVALPGQPYKQWINIKNHVLNSDPGLPAYNTVTLLPYMTGKDASVNGGPTAYTWYDELVVSTTAIAAPKN